MKRFLLCLALLIGMASAQAATTCYAARVNATLPPETVGQNLVLNLYSINGEGTKTHVVAILS